jgi:NADH-quinone oxidoreductase subunit E
METVNYAESIRKIVQRWKNKEGNLIMVLHQVQSLYGYVPRQAALEVASQLKVPLARIYEVITFYHLFKINPPGKHNVSVCLGTACYLRGGSRLVDEFKKTLKIEEDQTTPDGEVHLQIVRCIGCCGIAPAIVVDNEVHGSVKPEEIKGIMEGITSKETVHAN